MDKKQYRKMYLAYIREREIYYSAGERGFIEIDQFEDIEQHNLDEYLHNGGHHLLTRDEMGYTPCNRVYAQARLNQLGQVAQKRLAERGRK